MFGLSLNWLSTSNRGGCCSSCDAPVAWWRSSFPFCCWLFFLVRLGLSCSLHGVHSLPPVCVLGWCWCWIYPGLCCSWIFPLALPLLPFIACFASAFHLIDSPIHAPCGVSTCALWPSSSRRLGQLWALCECLLRALRLRLIKPNCISGILNLRLIGIVCHQLLQLLLRVQLLLWFLVLLGPLPITATTQLLLSLLRHLLQLLLLVPNSQDRRTRSKRECSVLGKRDCGQGLPFVKGLQSQDQLPQHNFDLTCTWCFGLRVLSNLLLFSLLLSTTGFCPGSQTIPCPILSPLPERPRSTALQLELDCLLPCSERNGALGCNNQNSGCEDFGSRPFVPICDPNARVAFSWWNLPSTGSDRHSSFCKERRTFDGSPFGSTSGEFDRFGAAHFGRCYDRAQHFTGCSADVRRCKRIRSSLRSRDAGFVGGFQCSGPPFDERLRPGHRRIWNPRLSQRRDGCGASNFGSGRNGFEVGGDSGRCGREDSFLLSWRGGAYYCYSEAKCFEADKGQGEADRKESHHGNLVGATLVTGSGHPCYVIPAGCHFREAEQDGVNFGYRQNYFDSLAASSDGFRQASCPQPRCRTSGLHEVSGSPPSFPNVSCYENSFEKCFPRRRTYCTSRRTGAASRFEGPHRSVFDDSAESIDHFGCPHCSRGVPRPRRRKFIFEFPVSERISEERKDAGGLVKPPRSVSPEGGTERLPTAEAHGAGSPRSSQFPGEGSLHQILGTPRWLCRESERLRISHVAPLQYCRSDGGRRSCRSSRNDGIDPGSPRTDSSGWWKVGNWLAPEFAGRSPQRGIQLTTKEYQPPSPGFCPSLSSGVGYNNPVLCEGSRPDQRKEDGSSAQPKGSAEPRQRRQGRRQEEKERGSLPSEAKSRGAELSAAPVAGANGEAGGRTCQFDRCYWKLVDPEAPVAIAADEKPAHKEPTPRSQLAEDLCSGGDQSSLCQDSDRIKSPETPLGSTQDVLHDGDPLPSWEGLQKYSFGRWASSLCREVLASRTAFAEFLKCSFAVHRSADIASEKVLFPLPVPKPGVFSGSTKQGSRCRRRKAFDQSFHAAIMALNFWHADFNFVSMRALSLIPSKAQARCLTHLRKMFKAYGNCEEEFCVPSSGRRTTSLTAQLADLCEFLTWQGASGDAYLRGFAGADGGLEEVRLDPNKERDEALCPYRALAPERLKLTGAGSWDPAKYLSDPLWLAYVEPASLVFCSSPRTDDVPDLKKEKYDDVLALARLWDAKGLLHLEKAGPAEDVTRVRFFNCFKSSTVDRMIGDRRARNAVEGIIPGASRALPTANLLSVLEIDPSSQRLSICVSDRKDFYHQFKTTPQRTRTNMCFPPLFVHDLEGTQALASWHVEQKAGKKRYNRLAQGDFLAGKPEQDDADPDGFLRACFASLPQGDALGVEFAVDGHRSLLRQNGLLTPDCELRADRVFRGSQNLSGLVIDDFYAISVVPQMSKGQIVNSLPWSVRSMNQAQRVYDKENILGSVEKDVYDADFAKVTGAELDSSIKTRKLGIVSLASPWKKRLALSFISLQLAKLRWTTDSLHLCLIGGWVHSLMYRRPMMSLLSDCFHLVDANEVSQESPKVIPLPRKVAQELQLLAVLSPFMLTDLATKISPEIFATDASDAKGAIVRASVPLEVSRALWRTGRRRGGYVRMQTREEALVRKLDFFDEPVDKAESLPVGGVDRPLALRFHFIEVCGGSGKVTRCMAERGWVVGPILDLDRSKFFDLSMLRVILWLYHLLEQGLLDSFMVEPPCTTFSPAQHPASRSYSCPRGFDPTEEKTLIGTTLALRALALIDKGAQVRAPGLLEQPKRSKMRRLSEWLYLIEVGLAKEFFTASCMYGSPHLKEFVFLTCWLDGSLMSRKCSRDHEHVQIAGKYTKPSATYVDALASAIADSFHAGLLTKLRVERFTNDKKGGLENPLCNEVLLSKKWETVAEWRWNRPRHINIHETSVVEVLFKKLALDGGGTRDVVALDSNVGLSALVKGRSSSLGLRPVLRRIGATLVAGNLFPAYHFAPTRWNPADHPTRDNEIPDPTPAGIDFDAPLCELLDFAQGEALRRPFANWVRLFCRLVPGPFPWFSQTESWRFMRHPIKHFPFRFVLRDSGFIQKEFDSTLGFPGEGPALCPLHHSANFPVYGLWILVWTWVLSFPTHASLEAAPLINALEFATFVFLCHSGSCLFPSAVASSVFLGCPVVAVSHGSVLQPRDAGDRKRLASRGDLELPQGRPVLGQTQKQRDKLLTDFSGWLDGEGISLQQILFVPEPDIETLNMQLERFGRSLYRAGRPYNHYAETINAISGKRPRVRRSLQPAWDLAYAWLRNEPPSHHLALPWQVLLSVLSTALVWGWPLVAGIIALSWGGLTRIGEALSALRCQLVLPKDVEHTADFILLQINEPKTRFRAARHQVARVDQPQLVKLIELVFRDLHPSQRLWPFSGQTMRQRFQKLLEANCLTKLPPPYHRGLDLGSLRAGGASWLLMRSEDSELTRRRGRWISSKIMEIYVQEVTALQFMPNLPAPTKQLILAGVNSFPWVLAKADDLRLAGIPEMVWPIVLKDEAVATELNGWKKRVADTLLAPSARVYNPLHSEEKGAAWEVRCWLSTSNLGGCCSSYPPLHLRPNPCSSFSRVADTLLAPSARVYNPLHSEEKGAAWEVRCYLRKKFCSYRWELHGQATTQTEGFLLSTYSEGMNHRSIVCQVLIHW